ncbi:MAG TPA: type I-U CRISPR-associated RAMP protein Csb1/Cas7u [Syntrophobacteraceae bacterium]|nr:type I-U CRISPR-associated RAMP protein Csb1/Cas7u [Syntrophobacteraceae bacterium]
MFEKLKEVNRILMQAELAPIQGDRFQPTGFADLGPATYQLPNGTRMLLVESAQSMANRFESTILGPDNDLIHDLKGLSYIRVVLTGDSKTTTNSLLEAHRINSPFIISDEGFKQKFKEAAGYDRYLPLNWKRIAKAVFCYDVNSLLHGVFLANLEDGRIKIPRALSAFIEARGVREAVSGGAKNNPIDPTGKLRAKDYDKDVYGNVPYQRVEFTAEAITAYFNVDVGILRSYDLGKDAFELLLSLALFKVRSFLDGGMRLRTACDLKLKDGITVTEPASFEVPAKDDLLKLVKEGIKRCKPMFAEPAVTELETLVVLKKAKEEQGVAQ